MFTRPTPPRVALPLFSTEAGRLTRYRPPFRFTSFFSPEDTLLCAMVAGDAARRLDAPRTVELTAGSGLVGFAALDAAPEATLYGVDVDVAAPPIATANAVLLGLADRARFEVLSLWDDGLAARLGTLAPDLIVCNPPYIPEPPGERLAVEAGSGPDGAEHVRRAIDLTAGVRARSLVLSWCSLSDPAGIVRAAADAGYALEELGVVAIADGEYSGSVHDYLKTLPTAYLNDWPETVLAIAPDGAAEFAYLLLAGAFRRSETPVDPAVTEEIAVLMRRFAAGGLAVLRDPRVSVPTRCWLLDRWDEIALRVEVHGPVRDLVSPVRSPLPRPAAPDAR
jgi:Methyltransferase small domain